MTLTKTLQKDCYSEVLVKVVIPAFGFLHHVPVLVFEKLRGNQHEAST